MVFKLSRTSSRSEEYLKKFRMVDIDSLESLKETYIKNGSEDMIIDFDRMTIEIYDENRE